MSAGHERLLPRCCARAPWEEMNVSPPAAEILSMRKRWGGKTERLPAAQGLMRNEASCWANATESLMRM